MFPRSTRLVRRSTLAFVLAAASVSGVGVAAVHRSLATQTTGSNGATNFLQTTETSSALQGTVGVNDTTYATPFGMFGVFNPTHGTFGIGVLGISTTGYGVAAETLNDQPSILAYPGGNGIGLEATTTSSSPADAVYAVAKGAGSGVHGVSTASGYGVLGFSQTGYSVIGTTPGAGGIGELGSPNGEGVIAVGFSGNSVHPALSVQQQAPGSDLLGMYNSNGTETVLVRAATANRSSLTLNGSSDVQIAGDLYLYGRIYQNCQNFPVTTTTGCSNVPLTAATTASVTRTVNDTNVRTFASRQTLPTMEDFGEAHMSNGRAYVRIDPAFAATMERAPYLVFLTPSGDCRGLYVTKRSLSGFEVRELGGGRATVDFDYRIVATPVGERPERLAVIPEKKPPVESAPDPAYVARRAELLALKHPHAPPAIVGLGDPTALVRSKR